MAEATTATDVSPEDGRAPRKGVLRLLRENPYVFGLSAVSSLLLPPSASIVHQHAQSLTVLFVV